MLIMKRKYKILQLKKKKKSDSGSSWEVDLIILVSPNWKHWKCCREDIRAHTAA